MLAVHLENGTLAVVEKAVPKTPAGEVLVRVRCAGICNTDLELLRGYYPFTGTPGHEFVGVVEEGSAIWQGRRVCGEINAACGRCEACRSNRGTHCEKRTVLGILARDGAFAEYVILPEENVVPVPESVSDEEAVFAEPLAAALQVTEQIHIRPTDRVAVIGDGKLGNLLAQVLSLRGCRLTVVGKHANKLETLAGRGIRTLRHDDVASLEILRADIVVEATGNPEGFALARSILRPQGILVLKSTYHEKMTVDMSGIVVDEMTLVGSRCGPFRPALELLARGLVAIRPLIHARYPMRDALAAFRHAQQPGVLKVLLIP